MVAWRGGGGGKTTVNTEQTGMFIEDGNCNIDFFTKKPTTGTYTPDLQIKYLDATNTSEINMNSVLNLNGKNDLFANLSDFVNVTYQKDDSTKNIILNFNFGNAPSGYTNVFKITNAELDASLLSGAASIDETQYATTFEISNVSGSRTRIEDQKLYLWADGFAKIGFEHPGDGQLMYLGREGHYFGGDGSGGTTIPTATSYWTQIAPTGIIIDSILSESRSIDFKNYYHSWYTSTDSSTQIITIGSKTDVAIIGAKIKFTPRSYLDVDSLMPGHHGSLDFHCGYDAATTASPVVSITSAGRVGIGTKTPDEKLHVDGNVKVTGSMHVRNGLVVTGTNDDGMLYIGNKASNFDNETIYLQTSIDGRGLGSHDGYAEEYRYRLELQPDFGVVDIGGELTVNGGLIIKNGDTSDQLTFYRNGPYTIGISEDATPKLLLKGNVQVNGVIESGSSPSINTSDVIWKHQWTGNGEVNGIYNDYWNLHFTQNHVSNNIVYKLKQRTKAISRSDSTNIDSTLNIDYDLMIFGGKGDIEMPGSLTISKDLLVEGILKCYKPLNLGFNQNAIFSHNMSINEDWKVILFLGNRFTGIISISSVDNDRSTGVWSVASNSTVYGGSIILVNMKTDYYTPYTQVELQFEQHTGKLQTRRPNDVSNRYYYVTYIGSSY
jgi:hypothetical protein